MKCVMRTIKKGMDEACKIKCKLNLQESRKLLQDYLVQSQLIQSDSKAVFDFLINAVDFVILSRLWLPQILGFQIFNCVSESESLIRDSKDMDSRVNNHKSCEFWNSDNFTLRSHYILLRPCLSMVHF